MAKNLHKEIFATTLSLGANGGVGKIHFNGMEALAEKSDRWTWY